METHEVKTPVRDTVLRAIAVLGLIAVLLLGAWGIIQLAVAIPTLFSNIGTGSFSFFTPAPAKETLTVDSIANLTSGQTLQVSWNHKNKDGAYSYAISYACKDGLTVKAPLPTGALQNVPCNTPFNFVTATDKMAIVPTVKVATPLILTVSATKLASGAVTSQGTATTNVAPAVAVTPVKPVTVKPATKPSTGGTTYVPAPVRAALYGYGDLAVRINSMTPSVNGLTSVVFTVENIGTNVVASGWMFNANLPINGSYLYTSAPQRSLNPGDKIVYTLTFSNAGNYNNYQYDPSGFSYSAPGYYTGPGYNNGNYNYGYNYSGPVTITVDPQNVVWEANEYNNTAYSN